MAHECLSACSPIGGGPASATTFWEELELVDWLTEYAQVSGLSRAGEIRAAIRFWRRANDRDG